MENWPLLIEQIRQFTSQNKLVGIVTDYIQIIENQGFAVDKSKSIFQINKIVCLNNLNDAELYAETLAHVLST